MHVFLLGRGAMIVADSARAKVSLEPTYLLTRKRIYILPTRAGRMFSGCLFLMLIGAINYNNSLAYALTFLLGAVAMVSILHTYRNQSELMIRGVRAASAHAGDITSFDLELRNPTPLARVGLMVRYGELSGADDAQAVLLRTDVAARDAKTVHIPLATQRRGPLAIRRVVISNRYPFGLFRAWSVIPLTLRLIVYPALNQLDELPVQRAGGDGDGGGGHSGVDDFAGLREYRPGDSPRMVHWKAAARSEVLPVKEMVGGGSRDLCIAWAETGGDTESRLSQLASWAVNAERGGYSYMLDLPGTQFSASNGPAHLERCLMALAMFDFKDHDMSEWS